MLPTLSQSIRAIFPSRDPSPKDSPSLVVDLSLVPMAPAAAQRRGAGFDGKGALGDSMAAVPELATWHGKQAELIPDSPESVARSAGLGWSAVLNPLATTVQGQLVRVPGSAVVRVDTGTVLGTVGPDYSLLQPGTVVDEAYQLADVLGTRVGAAGSFAGGRDVWALIQGQREETGPMGPGAFHLLFHSAMDGSRSFSLTPTHVLVCCQNTLAMALASKEGLRVRHVGDVKGKVQAVADAAVKGIEHARSVLRMVEESDVLDWALRVDEVSDFAYFELRGDLRSKSARLAYARAFSAPENRMEGRSRLAQVLQVMTWIGTHGGRGSDRSNLLGSHRAAVNAFLGRVLGWQEGEGAWDRVAQFRNARKEGRGIE